MRSFTAILLATLLVNLARGQDVNWKQSLNQEAAWYATSAAAQIADNLLLYQRDCGGWQKNIDMAAPIGEQQRLQLQPQRKKNATIDNGATYTQLRFLAKLLSATNKSPSKYQDAFNRGVDYLLSAQYENGGWPQEFPLESGYSRNVTFNDNAMIGVMTLLRHISQGEEPFAFVGEHRRAKAKQAIDLGVDAILKSQIVVNGRPTAWCAQCSEVDFRPTKARSYEHPSISGSESVGIVRYLMQIDSPSAEVVASIQNAVEWFDKSRIKGLRIERQPLENSPRGFDKAVVEDASAGDLWARFYEIETNQPIFSGRDGVIKRRLADIEIERRTGYSWYSSSPAAMLTKDYPRWQKRIVSRLLP